MKKVTYSSLAQSIEEQNIIDPETIHSALSTSRTMGRPFITVLLSEAQRHMDEEAEARVRKAIAGILEIPYIEDASSCAVDAELTKAIGLEKVEQTRVFVVTRKDGEKLIHAADPMDMESMTPVLSAIGGTSPEYCMMSPQASSSIYARDITPIIIAARAKSLELTSGDTEVDETQEEITDIAKMFNEIVNAGIGLRASDIHLSPESKNGLIRVRVDGVLREYMPIPLSALNKLTNYIVSQAKIPEPELAKTPRDGKLQFKDNNGREIPLRVALIDEASGRTDVDIRIHSGQKMTLEQLGMTAENIATIRRLFNMTRGIVLFTGPTGSGKSTSMYAGLRETDYKHLRVETVEDPVEQKMDGFLQIEVNNDAGITFKSAIVGFLRHDPDIIGVGEIRTPDVAAAAMDAAETGHLVISTLHSASAPETISRLTGDTINLSHQAVASSLSAVISQRLVRRVCPNCKEKYFLPADHPWRKEFNLGDGEIELVAKGKGCHLCEGYGYKGRVVLSEILICSRSIRAAIERKEPLDVIERLAAEGGYKPLIYDGVQKALDGITTFEELEPLYIDYSLTQKN